MPLAFHSDRPAMFEQQYRTAREHVIPFVAPHVDLEGASVLDIGCGDGGVLKAFAETGCSCVGVDLNQTRVDFAAKTFEQAGLSDSATFLYGDIHEEEVGRDWSSRFDLVILKDVVEHIPDKKRLMNRIRSFLRSGGLVFFGFPPWRMPYGGHQQLASTKLGKTPYIHLVPKSVYLSLLRTLGESEATIEGLAEIRSTRISIAQFERLVSETGFAIVEKEHFLFNPIYQYKFGLAPRKQLAIIRALPGLRDFFTTACYYLLAP